MKKNLHHSKYQNEIRERINSLKPDSKNIWGKMNAAQMLMHCAKILEVPNRKIILPEINFIFKAIGITTKKEMKILNNGIPPNMPTFKAVKVDYDCKFEESKLYLLNTIEEYLKNVSENNLPNEHELFGKMTKYDWGFMQYKHLNHHLKQFNV